MAQIFEAPWPEDLDLGPGFTLRVTALAVADGSVVSGVKVSNLAILAGDAGGTINIGNLEVGPWALVLGPGA